MLQKELHEYHDGNVLLEAMIARPTHLIGKKPAVMVVHDWSGKNEFACTKAEKLAERGYIGFALDMYGKGRLGNTNEEKLALMSPLMANRQMLQQRIQAAFTTVQQIPDVDPNKIAVIGFCFGGLCALDLARSGTNIAGAVSFHGLLGAPEHRGSEKITAKILALHGYNDPMAKPDQIIAFGDEMTAAHADWQLHMYGNTAHAFMNPLANDPAAGLVYKPETAARAWRLMEDFLNEIFSGK